MSLIEQLETRRAALSMPYTSLGRRAGLSTATVYGILQGNRTNSTFSTLQSIAEALGVRLVVSIETDLTPEEMRLEQARATAASAGCTPDQLLRRGSAVIWREASPNEGVRSSAADLAERLTDHFMQNGQFEAASRVPKL